MKRIQRQRTKGWRMPEGAVYVGRPSLWGNPFGDFDLPLDVSLTLYRNLARGIWSPKPLLALDISDEVGAEVYRAHCEWSHRMGDHPLSMIRTRLAGKDLACWCPLDQPCHADILLELVIPDKPRRAVK